MAAVVTRVNGYTGEVTFSVEGAPPGVTITVGPITTSVQLTSSNITLDVAPSATLTASYAWIGGAAATLEVPDLSTVAGWNNAWPPAPNTGTIWSVTATGTNITGSQCKEDGFIRTARLVGSVD